MKKIASGDGWFEIQMSAEERASLLHGLKFTLKNFDAFDRIELVDERFVKKDIRVLTEKTKPVKDGFVSRMDMDEFVSISQTLWSMLATIRANQIDVAKLDSALDVKKLESAKKAFDEVMPDNERAVELYPKERRKHILEHQAIWGNANGKNSP